MISIRTFRFILLLLTACLFLGGIDLVLSRRTLPPELQTYKHSVAAADRAGGSLALEGALSGGFILAYLVAIIGLYRFWPFSRPLFVITIVVGFILSFSFGPRVEARSVASFDDAISVLEGVVIALLYWSPIRERFKRTNVVNHCAPHS